ncbi:hypothetical protein Sfulv_23820 [Streptomyces fulvorobeus]|uniref:Uncharacterized protein n=1 Tax=Streptomyces fulvorobeus TaxID=284028 RepID=A0A7J0C501_9ACTN|nr:hypothetical protein Sfulv_23820 [Streptomyces fulvorobeus]
MAPPPHLPAVLPTRRETGRLPGAQRLSRTAPRGGAPRSSPAPDGGAYRPPGPPAEPAGEECEGVQKRLSKGSDPLFRHRSVTQREVPGPWA